MDDRYLQISPNECFRVACHGALCLRSTLSVDDRALQQNVVRTAPRAFGENAIVTKVTLKCLAPFLFPVSCFLFPALANNVVEPWGAHGMVPHGSGMC